jgi:hypothetical protein
VPPGIGATGTPTQRDPTVEQPQIRTVEVGRVQVLHSQFAEQITPFNRALQSGAAGLYYGPSTPFGIQGAETQVQYHALVSAYANDFLMMFWVCLPMLPLLFFMKKPQTKMLKPVELAME